MRVSMEEARGNIMEDSKQGRLELTRISTSSAPSFSGFPLSQGPSTPSPRHQSRDGTDSLPLASSCLFLFSASVSPSGTEVPLQTASAEVKGFHLRILQARQS